MLKGWAQQSFEAVLTRGLEVEAIVIGGRTMFPSFKKKGGGCGRKKFYTCLKTGGRKKFWTRNFPILSSPSPVGAFQWHRGK